MSKAPKQQNSEVIAHHIDENLKEVFAEYAGGDLPMEIVDLLSVLKAQDQAKDSK